MSVQLNSNRWTMADSAIVSKTSAPVVSGLGRN